MKIRFIEAICKLYLIDNPLCMCGKSAEIAEHCAFVFNCESYVNEKSTSILSHTIQNFLKIPKEQVTLDILIHVKWSIDENDVLFSLVYI